MIPQVYYDINLDPSYNIISNVNTSSAENQLPLLKEYDYDFDNNQIRYENGKPVILEGLEALKVQNKKALKTERFRYLGYSWEYGSELDTLIGNSMSKEVIKSEGKRLIEECLLTNPYNKSIESVDVKIENRKTTFFIKVNTIYGEDLINV